MVSTIALGPSNVNVKSFKPINTKIYFYLINWRGTELIFILFSPGYSIYIAFDEVFIVKFEIRNRKGLYRAY